jgi:phenylacetic acid degradation operon negative regulatory protein
MNAGAKAIAPEATLTQLLKRTKPAAQSLIVTLFGDCVSQHGDSLWLGSLIGLLDLFSINERLTRTSVIPVGAGRLADGAPHRTPQLLPLSRRMGQREYERTARAVYSSTRPHGTARGRSRYCTMCPAARETLRTSLGWIGFGQLAPGVFARPSATGRSHRSHRRAVARTATCW